MRHLQGTDQCCPSLIRDTNSILRKDLGAPRKYNIASLPPELSQQLRQVVKEEHRTVSELLREAIRLYMEAREWRRREDWKTVVPPDGTG